MWDPRTPRLTTNAHLKENLNYTSIQIVRILYIFDVAITNTTCSHATKMTSNRKIMLTSYRNHNYGSCTLLLAVTNLSICTCMCTVMQLNTEHAALKSYAPLYLPSTCIYMYTSWVIHVATTKPLPFADQTK